MDQTIPFSHEVARIMRLCWKNAILITCIAFCGVAAIWGFHLIRTKQQLSKEAKLTFAIAAQGNVRAETKLGSMYYYGRGVPQNFREALRWYRKAADQGDSDAQADIGSLYYYGLGVPKNYDEALTWYRKAVGQHNARAECDLGSMYYDGHGVQQDLATAATWYRQAADQGLAKAQYDLGYMYFHGKGVPENNIEGRRWYHKAAAQGHVDAQRALGLRGNRLSIVDQMCFFVMFLACLWAIIGPRSLAERLQKRQQRALQIAGISGITYIALSVYGAVASFSSWFAANEFVFCKNLAAGICIAMCLAIFMGKNSRIALGVSAILVIGIDLLLAVRHEFRHFAENVRGFYSINGLLIGITVSIAICTWMTKKRSLTRPGTWLP